MNNKSIIKRCEIQGLRMTDQRRTIATLLDSITDHPDVEELHRRINEVDRSISLATVYRTVKLFEESGILEKLEFGDGRARYEDADREHHDHLINIQNGEVIEFVNSDIEKLQEKIAKDLGFKLLGHKLELYGVPIDKKTSI
ncbi:MAG: Fur family transcriptional regulator [Paracoccaceae bacterium]|nr:Fur family transcriptional regulator [Paracoccaceae bacterium]